MDTTQPTLPASTPKGPIIVLGKDNHFLYVAPSVALMVSNIGLYLSGDGEGMPDPATPQNDRLCLDELEFFDSVARRLEPVVDADGKPLDLIIKPDYQMEIRTRIRRTLIVAGEMAQGDTDTAVPPNMPPVVPSDELSFDEFLETVMNDPSMTFDRASSCTWLARWLGLC